MSKRHSSAFTDDLLPADIEQLQIASKLPFWQSTLSAHKHRRWRAVLASAWIALALFGSSLWWMLGWIQPPRPMHLSLIGAGYETNLSVPHNALGWGTLADLTHLARGSAATRNSAARWEGPESPTLLTNHTAWGSDWENLQESTLFVYISAHGSVDADGPYLIAHDGTPADPAGRVRVSELLTRLAAIPPKTHKIVFLDVTHFEANPSYGCLHNDFPHALQALDADIANIPNLVVVNSCDAGQLSHVSHTHRRTIFGHTVAEGLRGAVVDANADGRIDASDFFQFVQSQVVTWTCTNRDTQQVPVLLPSGEEGRARARRIDLRVAQVPYQPKEIPQLDNAAIAGLQRVWNAYSNLNENLPRLDVQAAGLRRAYETALVRYEELIQAGDATNARLIEERLRSLQYQMEWEQNLFSVHNPGSLALARTIFFSDELNANSAAIAQISSELWNVQPTAQTLIWEKAVAHWATQGLALDPLRFALLSLAYERAVANPLQDLERAASVASVIRDPLAPVPVEIHFLEMLAKFLPADARGVSDQHRLRRGLEVKQLAERVAISCDDFQPSSLALEIKPWIEEAAGAADRTRRQAEDLLFADAGDRERADVLFESAEQQYRAIQSLAHELSTALQLAHQALGEARNFSLWISSLSTPGGLGDAEVLVQRYEAMCVGAIELMDLLHSVPAVDPTASQLTELQNQIPTQYERLSDSYATLKADFEEWWQLQAAAGASDWLSLANACQTTEGGFEQRLALYEKIRNSEQMIDFTPSKITFIRKVDSTFLKLSPAQTASDPRESTTLQELRLSEVRRAALRARLALSIIGEDLFNALAVGPQAETYSQLKFRLSVLTANESWRHSLRVTGTQIAQRLSRLPEFIASDTEQRVSQATPAPSRVDNASFQLAQKMEWQFGGLLGEVPSESPTLRRRSLLQSCLFAWLAERVETDHWTSGSVEEAYFKEAAENYLQTATRLWPDNPRIALLHQQLDAPEALELNTPDAIDLTTESELAFDVQVTLNPSADLPQGYAILSTTSNGELLQLIQPTPGKKRVHDLSTGSTASSESITLANPRALSWLPFEPKSVKVQGPLFVSKDSPPLSGAEPVLATDPAIVVTCFFRGRTLERTIPLALNTSPSLTSTTPIRPETAELLVRASKKLNLAHGLGEGAIAFVLDASGSMGALPGKMFDDSAKYRQATRALEQVLSQLPRGIQVSVWTFGQAMGPQKTVLRAEQTIRRVVPPLVWNREDVGQLRAIMKTLEYPHVEPWNASPVVDAILAAKQDLIGSSGFKSVVVITDGVDSRMSQTAETQQSPSDVSSILKAAFDGTDIVLNVIGFRVEAEDEQVARTQFRATESFNPAGRYLESKDTEELANVLQSLLHQRVQYWLDDYSNAELPAGRKRLPVADTAQDDSWYPGGLQPGTYNLWNSASTRPTRLSVRGGNRLVLELDERNGDVAANRSDFLRTDFSWKPTATVNQWLVAALENRINGQRLELLLGLERLPTPDPSLVEQVEPLDVWFEVTPTEHVADVSQPASSLHWMRTYDYPVPTYRLSVQDWPRDQNHRPLSATCQVWFNPHRHTPAGLRIQRGQDFDQLSQLEQLSWEVHGDKLQFEEIKVEQRSVLAANGDVETHPCLVVRVAQSGLYPVWVQPMGLKLAGKQHMHYHALGKTTAMFWPVTADELHSALTGFEAISPLELKEQAELAGYHVELQLEPAVADDIAFPPLVRRSAYE